MPDAAATFVRRWGLDGRSEAALRELSLEEQAQIFVGFDPGGSGRSVDAELMSCVLDVQGQRGRGALDADAAGGDAFEGAGDPGDTGRALEEFVARWGLDPNSQQRLERLPAGTLLTIMRDFDPPANTHNVDAKLNAFLRICTQNQGPYDPVSSPRSGLMAPQVHREAPQLHHAAAAPRAFAGAADDVAAFAAAWQLDEQSEVMLRSLPEDVCLDVLANFQPAEGTRNMNAKLGAFVRAKRGEWTAPEKASTAAPWQPSPAVDITTDDIHAFAMRWCLDDKSRDMLASIPLNVCAEVMQGFYPPPETQNVSARLHSFVKSIMDKAGERGQRTAQQPGGRPRPAFPAPSAGRAELDAFAEQWGLDSDSLGMLQRLRSDQLAAVIAEFNPPAGTFNFNGKLTGFVRSILTREGGGEGGGTVRARGGHWEGAQGGEGGGWRPSGPPPAQPRNHAPEWAASGDPVAAFAAQWGLDERAVEKLRCQTPQIQAEVISEFNPPATTVNASGKVSAFIRAKLGAQGGQSSGMMSQPAPMEQDVLQAFVNRWNLDAEACQLLQSLPDDLLGDVVRGFSPRADTVNPSGRLVAFVRHRLGEMQGRTERVEIPPPSSVGSTSSFPALNAPWRRQQAAQAGSDDMAMFVQQWGLDQSSEALLRSLPEDVQAIVVGGFQPEANTRNVNAKLSTWIRSLQAARSGEPDQKRQRM